MIDVGQQRSATKGRNKLSILLMDGNSERLALRKRIMALHGVVVVGACDSTEAASIWRRDRYDAVLIDIRRDHHGCVAWRDEIKKEKPQLAGSYVAEEQAAHSGDSLRKAIRESCASLWMGERHIGNGFDFRNLQCPQSGFVERLIGIVRREFLDRTLFWTTADLETKLVDFQHYYNGHRTLALLDGRPPEPSLGEFARDRCCSS
jgi:CheY-like chemotaxis protein